MSQSWVGWEINQIPKQINIQFFNKKPQLVYGFVNLRFLQYLTVLIMQSAVEQWQRFKSLVLLDWIFLSRKLFNIYHLSVKKFDITVQKQHSRSFENQNNLVGLEKNNRKMKKDFKKVHFQNRIFLAMKGFRLAALHNGACF